MEQNKVYRIPNETLKSITQHIGFLNITKLIQDQILKPSNSEISLDYKAYKSYIFIGEHDKKGIPNGIVRLIYPTG